MATLSKINKYAAAGRMSLNSPGVAEPAKRVAERPASKEAQNPPQITAAAGGISASAEHRRRP